MFDKWVKRAKNNRARKVREEKALQRIEALLSMFQNTIRNDSIRIENLGHLKEGVRAIFVDHGINVRFETLSSFPERDSTRRMVGGRYFLSVVKVSIEKEPIEATIGIWTDLGGADKTATK